MKENRNMTTRQTESDGQQKLPVALAAFDIVRETLISALGNTAELRQALLACDEWIANVVNYSAAKDFAFSFLVDGSTLHVSFTDGALRTTGFRLTRRCMPVQRRNLKPLTWAVWELRLSGKSLPIWRTSG